MKDELQGAPVREARVEAEYAGFIRAVAVLALPGDQQVLRLRSMFLPGEAVNADELTYEVDDGLRQLPAFVRHGWVPERALDALRDLDAHLGRMSPPRTRGVTGIDHLESAPDWAEARLLAGTAVALL